MQGHSTFAKDLARGARKFGVRKLGDEKFGSEPTIARRRGMRSGDYPINVYSLLETDGVLHWEFGPGPSPARAERRRGRYGPSVRPRGAQVLERFKFEQLPPNRIGDTLRSWDLRLTPNQGLRELRGVDSDPHGVEPRRRGRILLLVHGTFSNGENLLTELQSTADGAAFLQRAIAGRDGSRGYDQVLLFNHPTLSVSPILNAVTLGSLFRESDADVDVICHSRGGLVVRWWLEMIDQRQKPRGNVVFVGSPLAGTGLAAPHQLKGALDVFANIAAALKWAARGAGFVFPIAAPLGEVVAGLVGLFQKAMEFAAKSPLLDAGVSLIPGLAAQAREGANGEIIRLRSSFKGLARQQDLLSRYHFVTSNFEPQSPGWRFWRHFRPAQLADHGADLVFEGDNDLVVDTSSMCDLADGIGVDDLADPARQHHGFGTSQTVHHCNYFRQPEVVAMLERVCAERPS